MNQHLIQTGRSHRQMLNAVDLANKGIQVVYVERDSSSARDRLSRFRRMCAVPNGLSVAAMTEIERRNGGFNWATMLPADMRDPRAGLVYIVDHTLAEEEYQRLAMSVMNLQIRMQQIYPLTTGAKVYAIGEHEFDAHAAREKRFADKG